MTGRGPSRRRISFAFQFEGCLNRRTIPEDLLSLNVKSSANPFLAKEIGGRKVWLSLVEFSCGLDEKHCVDCATVIIYEPVTKQHRFVNPDDLIGQAGRKSDDNETADDGSI
jgi:hypothetical protein